MTTHVLTTLPTLAAQINERHGTAVRHAQSAIEAAIECGRLLTAAKTQVPHGEWLPWIEDNLSFAPRQAQKYMRVAQHAAELPNATSKSYLTIDRALEALADHRAEESADEIVPASVYLAEQQPLGDGEIRIALDDVLPAPKEARRLQINKSHIERLARYLPDLPAIEINQRNELVDGWYRLEAHKLAGAKTIRARVTHVASECEHVMLFAERNSSHGLSYTLDDERYQNEKR